MYVKIEYIKIKIYIGNILGFIRIILIYYIKIYQMIYINKNIIKYLGYK